MGSQQSAVRQILSNIMDDATILVGKKEEFIVRDTNLSNDSIEVLLTMYITIICTCVLCFTALTIFLYTYRKNILGWFYYIRWNTFGSIPPISTLIPEDNDHQILTQ